MAPLETLGQQVGDLILRRNLVQSHVAILDSFIRKVLSDVDMLDTLPTTDYVVRPFDARHVAMLLLNLFWEFWTVLHIQNEPMRHWHRLLLDEFLVNVWVLLDELFDIGVPVQAGPFIRLLHLQS